MTAAKPHAHTIARAAHPYAQAAFDHALQQQTLDKWTRMLALLAELVQSSAVIAVLKNPRYNMEIRSEMMLALAKDVLDEVGKNFIKILAANQRLTLLPDIYLLFEQLRAAAQKTLAVKVKSAIPLVDTQLAELNTALNKRFGRHIELETEIDTNLLGGLIVYADDQVIDNSLRGRLEKLKEAVTI